MMGVGISAVLAIFIAIIVWGPGLLVTQGNATDDAYLKALSDNRTALVQAVGGFGVFLGVVVGFFTLRHNRQLLAASRNEHVESLQANRDAVERTLAFNRESLLKTLAVTERGQITDRFSKAIDHLGQPGDHGLDLCLGGIYALEQIAKDSPAWHRPVMEVLAAFIRQHAVGLPPPELSTIEAQAQALDLMGIEGGKWVTLRVDIAAALHVLSRRDTDKDELLVNLQGADFRRADFPVNIKLQNIDFSGAHLQFSTLMFVDLRGSYFLKTELR